MPSGTYAALVRQGILQVAHGLRVQPTAQLMETIKAWNPALLVADRFRYNDLLDSGPSCPIQSRIGRWSESSADIRAVRKMALDGNLAIEETSRPLLQHSLSVSQVENDDSGNHRLVKSKNNHARDDVAQALALACGAVARGSLPRPFTYKVIQ